ncbi:MAG: transglycosylase domain-containing protein [Desulfobulbaceae bacterium]|nr:transglycosylase domain-containing protein [Desulfobulbaceae bacterium]
MIKKLFLWMLGLLGIATMAFAAVSYWFIFMYPGDEIGPESLKKLMGIESPVYFQDGVNKVGVIFQDSHRQYLTYDKIPKDFVLALIAAEDHSFFSHYGVDVQGIIRAMIANLQAGRVVQGGSTLTQQAAKNLFKREGRSFKEKAKELYYALRLEAHYSKEKIFEFYANQFYVSGNGLGLGVAAKYYFDKDVEQLSLIENAFIAGSVKRPNYYNPFIKRDKESVKAARKRARERTDYVLGQMLETKMISEAVYKENLSQEIPFKQGQMSFVVNTVMDVVKEALAEPEVEEVLAANGIDNVAVSGIKIFTTIDKELQAFGLKATRQELSRLSVRLLGYDQRALQEAYQKTAKKTTPQEEGDFVFGKVLEVNPRVPTIVVSLGDTSKNGVMTEIKGVIDREGLMPMVEAQAKYAGQRWSEADQKQLLQFASTFQVDDLVYVALRQQDPSSDHFLLDLQKYPDLQGAIIAVQEGKIRTMIGGSENRFFNRAMDAKRIMGSVVKPLVYSAALQLGWNSADLLDNERGAFLYQNQEYFPRPDHISPFHWVSMNWAGVKSENLATIWLLYHLCDRLNPNQFKELLNNVGLGRGQDESYQQYATRIRDQFGILINDQSLRRLAFDRAIELIGPDLLFDGNSAENDLLHHFHYQLEGKTEDNDKEKEIEVRQQAVARTFVDQQRYFRQLLSYKMQIESGGEIDTQGMSALPAEGAPVAATLFAGPQGYRLAESSPGPEWRRLSMEEVLTAWQASQDPDFWGSISLNGLLKAGTFRQLSELVGQEFQRLRALPAYDPEVLHQSHDFRVLAGLRYLIALVREMGIESPLEPVLSFPLGSNVISLLEVARSYETMVTGESYRTGRPNAGASLMVIDRIEDSEGNLLYRPERVAKRVLDAKTALCVSDILKNVVKYGTGRYARTRIQLTSPDEKRQDILDNLDLEVPVLGKTGTANEFRNSSFAGYVPAVADEGNGFALRRGYALAAYEGFDDNIAMTRKSSHVTGSAGALILWSEMADAILNNPGYTDTLNLENLPFSTDIEFPLQYPDLGQIVAKQTTVAGISSQIGDSAALAPTADRSVWQIGPNVVTFGKIIAGGELTPDRSFTPFWGEH